MSSSTLSIVQNLKASLAKQLPLDGSDVDQCRDILQRLEECPMTLDVLSQTLIGTVVSKFKTHTELGPIAKALVKKWKQDLAKQSVSPPVAAAVARQVSSGSTKTTRNKATTTTTTSGATNTSSAAQAAWADFSPLRRNICNKLLGMLELSRSDLGLPDKAFSEVCVSCVIDIEAAIQIQLGRNPQACADKARSLCFNLKKNVELRRNILMGSTSADELVTMTSEQLATVEKAQAREAQVQKLRDSRRLDWEQANEDKINEMCGIKGELLSASLFTCGRCHSVKTTSTQKQTRSADEPMTVFVLCLNCGNRWKC